MERIRFVNKQGGTHHGHFLPSEDDSDEALALFTFESLAAYEQDRIAASIDPECIAAFDFTKPTHCIPSLRAPLCLARFRGLMRAS